MMRRSPSDHRTVDRKRLASMDHRRADLLGFYCLKWKKIDVVTPVPPTPEEMEEAEENAKRFIPEQHFKRMADYAARGRRFSGLSYAKLLKVWTKAYDKLEAEPDVDLAQEALVTDLNAEFEIRGIEPPYHEYSQGRRAKRRCRQRIANQIVVKGSLDNPKG
jgi:hypothetical protein